MSVLDEKPKSRKFLFTSESVTEGHPDKICDRIADAILDQCLQQDPEAKVACEVATKTGMIMVMGEITTKAQLDVAGTDIGYDASDKGLDADTCCVLVALNHQSEEIAKAVMKDDINEMCAGDQGIMFGYATNETPEMMPLSHILASNLARGLTSFRKSGKIKWLRPDGKTQVTVEYEKLANGHLQPLRVHTVLISAQHDPDVAKEDLKTGLMSIIKSVIPEKYLTKETIFYLNPSGSFVVGGPQSDAGLTGRKIIVDTYGGFGAHGGGSFSGKDPTKVDRSGAYAARWIAKSIVNQGLAQRCLVQVSYGIGICKPLSLFVDTYGTGVKPDWELEKIVEKNFDLRPHAIIMDLKLLKPIYEETSNYGHFGRNFEGCLWEIPKELKL